MLEARRGVFCSTRAEATSDAASRVAEKPGMCLSQGSCVIHGALNTSSAVGRFCGSVARSSDTVSRAAAEMLLLRWAALDARRGTSILH